MLMWLKLRKLSKPENNFESSFCSVSAYKGKLRTCNGCSALGVYNGYIVNDLNDVWYVCNINDSLKITTFDMTSSLAQLNQILFRHLFDHRCCSSKITQYGSWTQEYSAYSTIHTIFFYFKARGGGGGGSGSSRPRELQALLTWAFVV